MQRPTRAEVGSYAVVLALGGAIDALLPDLPVCRATIVEKAATGWECAEFWLSRYHTLIAGLIALGVGWIAVSPVWRQWRSMEGARLLQVQDVAIRRSREMSDVASFDDRLQKIGTEIRDAADDLFAVAHGMKKASEVFPAARSALEIASGSVQQERIYLDRARGSFLGGSRISDDLAVAKSTLATAHGNLRGTVYALRKLIVTSSRPSFALPASVAKEDLLAIADRATDVTRELSKIGDALTGRISEEQEQLGRYLSQLNRTGCLNAPDAPPAPGPPLASGSGPPCASRTTARAVRRRRSPGHGRFGRSCREHEGGKAGAWAPPEAAPNVGATLRTRAAASSLLEPD